MVLVAAGAVEMLFGLESFGEGWPPMVSNLADAVTRKADYGWIVDSASVDFSIAMMQVHPEWHHWACGR